MKAPQPPKGTPQPKYAVRNPSMYDGAICETMPLSREAAIANAREKRRMGGYVVAITSKGLRVRIGAIK